MNRFCATLPVLAACCGFDPEGVGSDTDTDPSSSTTEVSSSSTAVDATASSTSSSSTSSSSSSGEPSSEDSTTSGSDEESSSSGTVFVDHALSFEGQQHGVTEPLPGLPQNYTIEFWVRTEGELHGALLSSAAGDPIHGIFCYHETGEWTAFDNVLTFIDYNAPSPGWDYVVDPELDINEQPGWHHIALTKDASGLIRMFFDGGQVAQRQFSAPFALVERQLKVGLDGGGIIPLHGAVIDELRISSVARYDALFEPEKDLDADGDTLYLWHFDEGEGDDALDEVQGTVLSLTDPVWVER